MVSKSGILQFLQLKFSKFLMLFLNLLGGITAHPQPQPSCMAHSLRSFDLQYKLQFFLQILFSSLDNNSLWKRVAGRTLVFSYQSFVVGETMSYIMLVYDYQNLGFL